MARRLHAPRAEPQERPGWGAARGRGGDVPSCHFFPQSPATLRSRVRGVNSLAFFVRLTGATALDGTLPMLAQSPEMTRVQRAPNHVVGKSGRAPSREGS